VNTAISALTMTGASGMLVAALVILWRRHIPSYISAFQWQSVALAFTGAVVAWHERTAELFLVSGLMLAFKGVLVPMLLRRMAGRFPESQELQPIVNTEVSLLISGFLAIAAYEVSRPVAQVVSLPTRGGLPVAIALILISLFVVVSRRKAMTQIVGFLMLENGIALLALLGAYGVPLVVELGVFLDVLLGVLVMQAIVNRIQDAREPAAVAPAPRLES
jgi:hydrogenase-4 component E